VPAGPEELSVNHAAADGNIAAENLGMTADLDDLDRRRELAMSAGAPKAVARQRARGKMTARERIDLLLDPGSFLEIDDLVRHRSTAFDLAATRPYCDAVVVGLGTVGGRRVCVFAQDFTVFGGSLGGAMGEKIVKVLDLAEKIGCPVVGINDSVGGRIQEGVVAQAFYGEIFMRNVRLSGVIPQISLIMGPCAGGAVYSPALTDFVVMVEGTSQMFITGPEVVRITTGEDIGVEDLGGGRVHSTRSGNAHFLAPDDDAAIACARELLSYLPSNSGARPPKRAGPETDDLCPDPRLDLIAIARDGGIRNVRAVIDRILDGGRFLEVHARFAPNVVAGFGSIGSQSVGIVANQRTASGGWLDSDSSDKAARFVRTCDAFNVPVVTLVDSPGLRPASDAGWDGLARSAAKLIHAYAEATVPLVTVVVGDAVGAAYIVMGSKQLGADLNFAWPTARISVTSAPAEDVETVGPYEAAERGYVDRVIQPSATRPCLARSLRALETKEVLRFPKKHENITL
jgi:propionyl-CoA carboxylase beta chain